MTNEIDSIAGNDFFLKLSRPVLFISIKTTGVDINTDKILELSYIKYWPNKKPDHESVLFNPNKEITHGTFKKYGIDNSMVEKKPSFEDIAMQLKPIFSNCDFVGNNILFDFFIIQKEFKSAGVKIDLSDAKLANPLSIWHNYVTSGISEAIDFYLGIQPNQLNSISELVYSSKILLAQIKKHDLETDFEKIQDSSFNTDNLLHLAFNNVSKEYRTREEAFAKKELNSILAEIIASSNSDPGSFFQRLDREEITYLFSPSHFVVVKNGIKIKHTYEFFNELGFNLKPVKNSIIDQE